MNQTIPAPWNLWMRTLRNYGITLLSVGAAFLATLLMQRLFPYPFLFLFFGAVMVSAWFGGTLAGIFAVLVSTLLVEYFFVPPFYSFSVSTTAEAYFGAFVASALIASWLSSSKKKSEEALRDARDKLEVRVSQRTAQLMKTQSELAHLSRVLSMGELTASIAHEINQPLTAVVTNGHACVQWLSASRPNIERALQTANKIVEDGTRAGAVLSRIRSLFKKEPIARDWIDMNDVIKELTVFLRDEAKRRGILMRTDLGSNLPEVKADRVQMQQVVLNLLLNSFDAMAAVTSVRKELLISTRLAEPATILVRVEDWGAGFDSEDTEKMFDAFFTKKPQGIGMGLAISRTIVESHEGRLWAEPNPGGGAIFQFTIPTGGKRPSA